MIFAAISNVLAVVDGFIGFAIGFFVAWIIFRNRKYSIDLTIRKDGET